MITPSLLFELGSYGLAFLVLWKLFHEDRFLFLAFFAAIITTVLIEFTGIRQVHSYYYDQNDFLIMIGKGDAGFPLCIAVDWGLLIFAMMRIGKRLDVQWFVPPFVFALIAIALDLVLDPVAAASKLVNAPGVICTGSGLPPGEAIGLGFWVWCVPKGMTSTWLGIPLANFYAWFLVVISYSTVLTAAERFVKPPTPTLVQDIFILAGVIGLSFVSFEVLVNISMKLQALFGSSWYLLGPFVLAGLWGVYKCGTSRLEYSVDWWLLAVIGADIVFCWGAYFLTDLHVRADTQFVVTEIIATFVLVVLTFWVMFGWPRKSSDVQ